MYWLSPSSEFIQLNQNSTVSTYNFLSMAVRADFLSNAIALLEKSERFATFKNHVLNRHDYETEFYIPFKTQMAASIRDLKLRFSSKEVLFDKVELEMVFKSVVVACEKSIAEHDASMKAHKAAIDAHQTTVNAQNKVAASANHAAMYHPNQVNHPQDYTFENGIKVAKVGIEVARLFL